MRAALFTLSSSLWHDDDDDVDERDKTLMIQNRARTRTTEKLNLFQKMNGGAHPLKWSCESSLGPKSKKG